MAAAQAKRLELPTTKFSNRYLPTRVAVCSFSTITCRCSTSGKGGASRGSLALRYLSSTASPKLCLKACSINEECLSCTHCRWKSLGATRVTRLGPTSGSSRESHFCQLAVETE